MPHTPAHSDDRDSARSEGEFADLFARKAHTPLRGFLPGRRVWTAVGGSAAAVLVIAGSAAAVASIDWRADSSEKVTAAADESPKEKSASGDTKKETTAPSPKAKDKDKGAPDVVYVPVSGGSGAGAGTGGAEAAPGSDPTPGSDGTTGGTTGSNGSSGSTGSTDDQEKQSTTAENSGSQSTTGYLWTDGSVDSDTNDYWDQSTVTVKTTQSLTGLKVVVSIDQTGGVASTGVWSSLGDKVTVSSAADSNQLAYVVTLKSGNTIGPGTYTFKFQYNHSQGRRDAGGDRYNVTATSTGSDTEFKKGSF
ncbi:hypothetical protein Sipo8835_01135 [Streptomyces ipomoeae]|jgi:hypothetical protein|uniref:Uncharacterized protein n=2 Tax=Streptomyces ipomoeae TaxID=103232 RepID=L1KVV7_9ACTN|nr:hypothetical protein [Streptomyces ipomoeae]EKX64941.1 hypothetical protein STRIP9103_08818 [Streptomyces ipomoeae 91-03]MDX2696097.1 hypothetical protein [Streptomyces ipomoeae]MDX2821488.1 hypothetical protein [Streptomyces ipomoeae]MDX2841849.1 hypothetical protein [Streptomyces ipomoeae]MDX2876266.1 hypothetical protein [Streptomyces ipomoeae]